MLKIIILMAGAIARGLTRRKKYGDTSNLYLGTTYNVVKYCIPCQNTKENHDECINGEFKPYKIKKQVKFSDTGGQLIFGFAATTFGIFNYDNLFRLIFGLVAGFYALYFYFSNFGDGSSVTDEGYRISSNTMRSSGNWIDEPLFFVLGSKLKIIEKTNKKAIFMTERSFFDLKTIAALHGPNDGKLVDFYEPDYKPLMTFDILFMYRLWQQAMIKGRIYRVYNTTKRKDKVDEVQIIDMPKSL